jgi:protein with PEP-CTERM/exosortase system signal
MKPISKTILAVLAIGMLSCGVFSQQAQAAHLVGEIHMAGDVIFDTPNLGSSTTVETSISVQGSLNKATTFGATGDFAIVPALTEADMAHPWTFSPSTPTAPLWDLTMAGFPISFDLETILSITRIGENFLNILARGTVHATGFDDTTALFSFTVNNPDGLTHDTYGFANATITTQIPVPDGGTTVMLLGVAIGALGMARRFLKKLAA